MVVILICDRIQPNISLIFDILDYMELIVKNYISAMIWAYITFGDAGNRWNWTIERLGETGKFTFINNDDAFLFKLIWG